MEDVIITNDKQASGAHWRMRIHTHTHTHANTYQKQALLSLACCHLVLILFY